MRPLYRLQQLWRQLQRGPLTESARQEVEAALNEAEQGLFARFRPSDQWHSYRVFAMLRAADHTEPDLLTAALIHDVGKTLVPMTIWDRIAIVVLGSLLPERTAEWGRKTMSQWQVAGGKWQVEMERWRRPFVVKQQHPEWGARMAEEAGSRPLAVTLIRRHQDKLSGQPASVEDKLLVHLQWADDQN